MWRITLKYSYPTQCTLNYHHTHPTTKKKKKQWTLLSFPLGMGVRFRWHFAISELFLLLIDIIGKLWGTPQVMWVLWEHFGGRSAAWAVWVRLWPLNSCLLPRLCSLSGGQGSSASSSSPRIQCSAHLSDGSTCGADYGPWSLTVCSHFQQCRGCYYYIMYIIYCWYKTHVWSVVWVETFLSGWI